MNRVSVFVFLLSAALTAWTVTHQPSSVAWKINCTENIAEYSVAKLGNPAIKVEGGSASVAFNGVDDGLIIPAIGIKGWKQFTIEIKFKPDATGPTAPRFMHFQDSANNRGTFELRLTSNKQWYLDAFLKNGATNKGLTLIDSTKLHPADKWYWAAMTYDGRTMNSFVNGKKELEGEIDFPPMINGQTALGVRLNKVNWFKGEIAEIKFHPVVLQSYQLQRL